jgi:hypothetical protein
MSEAGVEDLFALDRDVGRAVAALERWRAGLAEHADEPADDDPFEGIRHTATRSTWRALNVLQTTSTDAPMRDALARWVAALIQARLGLPDEAAWAREAGVPRAWFGGDRPRWVGWRDAWRGLVSSRTAVEARLWLGAAAEAAAPLASINQARAARRVEVARRMGFGHPWDGAVAAPRDAVRSAAVRLLDATDDLSHALRRESTRDFADAATVLHDAMGRDAADGWPPPGAVRSWLEGVFGPHVPGLPIRLPVLPPAKGAASYARVLFAFGHELRLAAGSPSLPFALAREPIFVGAHRLGFVFGALAADPEFHVRVLRVGRRTALAQARRLACSALLEARLQAVRVLLGDDDAFAPADLFEELSTRLFGSRLDARLRGAWPPPREDDPGRLIALLEARALREELRQKFDSDWFRNPHAWAHLRSRGAAVAREPVAEEDLGPAANGLARAFEEALG